MGYLLPPSQHFPPQERLSLTPLHELRLTVYIRISLLSCFLQLLLYDRCDDTHEKKDTIRILLRFDFTRL